jgi:hypothetical protein
LFHSKIKRIFSCTIIDLSFRLSPDTIKHITSKPYPLTHLDKTVCVCASEIWNSVQGLEELRGNFSVTHKRNKFLKLCSYKPDTHQEPDMSVMMKTYELRVP